MPRAYQKEGVEFIKTGFLREGAAAMFLKPGLGKTTIALQSILEVKKANPSIKVLIMAPLRVCQISWPLELQKWLNFYDLTYTLLWGPTKEANLKKNVDIYIINYEGLAWLDEKIRRWPGFVIYDELTRLKNWSAKRVKLVKSRLYQFDLRLGLTGTPTAGGIKDLFSQIYMLDHGKRFGHSKVRFELEFFDRDPWNQFKITPKDFAHQEIGDRINDLCFTVDPAKHLDLPEIVYVPIYLDLPPKLKAKYKELKEECLVELNKETVITTTSAAAASMKLRQFLAGTVYDEDGKEHVVHDLKIQALTDFVEDLDGQPLLVGYHFRYEPGNIKKAIKDAILIPKGASETVLQEIALEWNKGTYPLLAGHPQSIGYGLNLQEATNLIFMLTLDFSADPHEQFIKRIARSGQTESHVLVHCPMFRGTIDEYVFEILQGKQFDQESFLMSLASNFDDFSTERSPF